MGKRDVEWYTDPKILAAARSVMNGITLDPASCRLANQTVQADHYYTEADDGLSKPWYGRVWLNHPSSRGENKLWIDKLMTEIASGRVSQAMCIAWLAPDTDWFRPLMTMPQWHPPERISFIPGAGQKESGSKRPVVVCYWGDNVDLFNTIFTRKLGGVVMVPYAYHKIMENTHG